MLDSLPDAALPYPAYKTQVSAVGRISASAIRHHPGDKMTSKPGRNKTKKKASARLAKVILEAM